jgi:hypothetical protein
MIICGIGLFWFASCSTKEKGPQIESSKISREVATEIARNEFLLLGYDLGNAILRIDPHPITVDSIMTKRVPCSWSNAGYWFNEVHAFLSISSFWRSYCFNPNVLDSDAEIYIDSNTGRVLYIFPLGTPEDLSKRGGRRK